MEKCKSSFVVAAGKGAILELAAGAAQFAEKVSLVALAAPVSAQGIDAVYTLEDPNASVALYAKAIVKLICEQKPELVLVEQSRNGRLLAGLIAAAFGTSVQTDVSEIEYDGAFVTKRAGYGGLAVKVERSAETAVICVSSGSFPAAGEVPCEAPVVLKAEGEGITFVEKKEKLQQRTNLSAARRVVCVGRGIGDEEKLALAEELAGVIEAEMGCTRPVAEEDHLMPTNRYIGVSGVSVKPELYVAVGVSGQVQHTSGVSATRVIAINKDEHAPIFSECDFGVVGEAKDVLPKLIALLKD
ncbi:MAG: electron transfer flavoprotein subunit alpha/FixB family protein [Oscillospiraceae bacterium]|nr:electron transfer flavoprotein subunit alpha/FixB family protein [Oscillospiraceae bacterium]